MEGWCLDEDCNVDLLLLLLYLIPMTPCCGPCLKVTLPTYLTHQGLVVEN